MIPLQMLSFEFSFESFSGQLWTVGLEYYQGLRPCFHYVNISDSSIYVHLLRYNLNFSNRKIALRNMLFIFYISVRPYYIDTFLGWGE